MLKNLKETLILAEQNCTAIGMFNATSLDMIDAEIRAAEQLNVPLIIAHAEVHNIYNDIELIAPAMIDAAKRAKIPVCVHLDHGVTDAMIHRALKLGFTSIMFDGSALPYQENFEKTKEFVKIAHEMGVSVEAELGRLMTEEDGRKSDWMTDAKAEDFYTNAEEAATFIAETGVDALAIAFGTAHGFYKEKPVLNFDVIKRVRAATNGIPLVMHGGSGVCDEDYVKAIDAGIRKINYYSYMSKAGYDAAAAVVASAETSYFHDLAAAAKTAMQKDVLRALKIFSKK